MPASMNPKNQVNKNLLQLHFSSTGEPRRVPLSSRSILLFIHFSPATIRRRLRLTLRFSYDSASDALLTFFSFLSFFSNLHLENTVF